MAGCRPAICLRKPTLLLPGSDKPHPAMTGAELAVLLPGVEILRDCHHLSLREA